MKPYVVVLTLSWLVFMVVWLVTARQANPSRRRTTWTSSPGVRVALVFLAVFLTRSTPLWSLRQTNAPLALAGCILCVSGVAFAVWARFSLGKNWGMPMTVRDEPALVTRGPYAFVRHPIYTGVTAALLGSALVTPFYAVIVVIYVFYFVYSARREEKDMLAQFPEQYGAYRKRTKMFVPFLFLF